MYFSFQIQYSVTTHTMSKLLCKATLALHNRDITFVHALFVYANRHVILLKGSEVINPPLISLSNVHIFFQQSVIYP